ncbi:RNA polymerase I-specific transcription initiation factor RRN3 [Hesseltinella vesiculosa]|uniref:RNA polymerase I-specific transcription initiation factor RRN3 n=1 Tax=Hesseltinella vesiculosa TaxID=101127 RepID=A0A1X2GSZ0_9FUNG|nr:RNA polymerase I-specific transcription initiation factor RRN3 [Hesseltinella vesiculosa]
MPSYAVATRTVAYDRHHEAIQDILKLIPTSYNSLYVCIQRHLPYKKRGTADHASYVRNLIQVMTYVPVLQKQIMTLLVEHLVRVDTLIQVEMDDLDEDVEFVTYSMNFDDDYESEVDSEAEDLAEDQGDDMNGNDSDLDSDYGADEDENSEKGELSTKQQKKVRSMVRKLDSMMYLVLGHLAAKQSPDARNDMYSILLDTFDRTIIKTLKSRYTQFLMFYLCSMDGHFSDSFLEHLLQLIMDPLRPNVHRIAAAAYVSSYVARAKFMEPTTIQRTVGTLCGFCEQLLDQYEVKYGTDDVAHAVNAERHEVFYASLQAVMYIFCFRWRDLTLHDDSLDALIDDDEPTGAMSLTNAPAFPGAQLIDAHLGTSNTTSIPDTDYSSLQFGSGDKKWCHGLRNMPRLIMNKLYPLKVCSLPVVRQFAKISHETNFMYIYSILEKSKDLLITGVNLDSVNDTGARNLLHTVQTFFPFDPYKLESSRKYIDSIYFEWIAEDDDEDDSDEEEDDEEEEDNMSAGMMAMSISPSPTSHYL